MFPQQHYISGKLNQNYFSKQSFKTKNIIEHKESHRVSYVIGTLLRNWRQLSRRRGPSLAGQVQCREREIFELILNGTGQG